MGDSISLWIGTGSNVHSGKRLKADENWNHLEGGWIGDKANLELNAKIKTNLQLHLVQPTSVAEFPVKGSGLTLFDSSE